MAELKKNLLRECPFCGSVKIRMWKNNWVQCESCCGSTGTYETEEEAIHAWNNRPTVNEAEIRAKALKYAQSRFRNTYETMVANKMENCINWADMLDLMVAEQLNGGLSE